MLYDPRRPEVIADPYPAFHRLQAEDPVHWSEILSGWVLTRYDDVRAALNDDRLSSDRITPFLEHCGRGRPEVQELGQLVGRWVVFTDPPTHTRLRQLMNTAFTSRAVERLRPRIQEVVDDLLGRNGLYVMLGHNIVAQLPPKAPRASAMALCLTAR